MTINISVPKTTIEAQLKPRISVVGVGGAGGNAVNNMIQCAMDGVDFVVANTDAQALALSRTDRRIQLGRDTTQGLGAGARPDIGRHAAEEAVEIIGRELEGAHMAFITAGMGGGTGTGAAPVIARIARELGVLTVGVVTKPFHFEGVHRMRLAEAGIEELAAFVDTLIVIPNQNLFRVANEKTTFADAFKMADDVLHGGVRSVTDLMMMPGLINLDFADVRTVMKEMGRAMMGTGEAAGDRRALDAAEAAIANPLLEETSMRGAKGVLINITGGADITLFEVDEAANRIRDEVETDAHIIFGSCFDETMEGKIRVSVVATGIESEAGVQPRPMAMARPETRAVGRRIPEVRTAAPTARSPVTAPSQSSFSQFGFGATLAPATGTMDLQSEEKALMEMTAAARLEPAQAEHAPPAPLPAQAAAAAVAEAVAKAPVVPVRAAAPLREVFIPKAPVEPRAEPRAEPRVESRMEPRIEARVEPRIEPRLESKVEPRFEPRFEAEPRMEMRSEMRSEPEARPAMMQAPKPAPAPAKAAETSRVSLFGRYRSLTARAKPEEAPRAPEPQAKVDRPTALNITVGASDRAAPPHDEDALEIPAFLRRQAN